MKSFVLFNSTHTVSSLICIQCNGGAISSGIKYAGILNNSDWSGKTRSYWLASAADIVIISNAFTCMADIRNASHQLMELLLRCCRILKERDERQIFDIHRYRK